MKITFGLAVFVLLFLAGCSPDSPETAAANHVLVPGDRAYYSGGSAVCPTKEVLSTWESELLDAHNVNDRVGELNSARKAFSEGCANIPAQTVLILDVSVFSGIAEFRLDDGNAYWGMYSDLKKLSEKQASAVVHHHPRKPAVQHHKDMRSMADMPPAYQQCAANVQENIPSIPNRDHTMMIAPGKIDIEEAVHSACDKFDK